MNNKLQLKRAGLGLGDVSVSMFYLQNLCDERKPEFKLFRLVQLTSLKKFILFLQNLYKKNIAELTPLEKLLHTKRSILNLSLKQKKGTNGKTSGIRTQPEVWLPVMY